MEKLIKELNNLRPTKEQVKDKPAYYAFGYVDAINSAIEIVKNNVSLYTFIPVSERLPEHLETVWLTNGKGWIALGCLVENDEQEEGHYSYHWAESNGTIYIEEGEIVSECESEDLDVTHWCALPTVEL